MTFQVILIFKADIPDHKIVTLITDILKSVISDTNSSKPLAKADLGQDP